MLTRATLAGLAVLAFLVTAVASARACPTCAQGIRQKVYAEVFGPDFVQNLGLTALPFVVLAGIAIAVHRAPGREPERRAPRPAAEKERLP